MQTHRVHPIPGDAGIHKSRLTQAWRNRGGPRLHFLPPYRPKGNRIERLRLDLHANATRHHRRRTIDELPRAVRGCLAQRCDLAQVIARAA